MVGAGATGAPYLHEVIRHRGHHHADVLLSQPVRGLLGERCEFLCHDGHHGGIPPYDRCALMMISGRRHCDLSGTARR